MPSLRSSTALSLTSWRIPGSRTSTQLKGHPERNHQSQSLKSSVQRGTLPRMTRGNGRSYVESRRRMTSGLMRPRSDGKRPKKVRLLASPMEVA